MMENLRAYLSPSAVRNGAEVTLCQEESHHLVKVRRARAGELISLLDGKGLEIKARIREEHPKRTSLVVEDEIHHTSPATRVSLALALLKGKNFEEVIKKAVELGVSRIYPLAADHSEVRLGGEREEAKVEKWKAHLVEAIKQSGNPFLPEISASAKVREVLDDVEREGNLVLYAGLESKNVQLSAMLKEREYEEVVWFIGPEGDFSKEEYSLLKARSSAGISLGPIILRSETAALSVLSTTAHLLRELG